MSEPDEKNELSKRPWDPAGTQPKHDPASLLPESSEPLLPPDAEVVESDAIDEDDDRDLLPERHQGAGAPAVAAGPSAYAPRFQFMTGALVAVGIAALIGIAIAIVGIRAQERGARLVVVEADHRRPAGRHGDRRPHRRRLPRPGQAAGQGRRERHLIPRHPAARRAAQVRGPGRGDPGP